MFDELLTGHIQAIKKSVDRGIMEKTDSIGIDVKNLEEFKFKLKNKDGVVNMAELIDMREWIDSAIKSSSWACRSFLFYHKDSPKYWGELGEKDPEYNEYTVQINLEPFMSEESESKDLGGFIIPDNYVLGDKVIERFEEAGNSIKGIGGEHFRECTNWKIKNKATAKKLIKFIDKNYVQPYIKELMDVHNIKRVIFLEDRMDFEYKEK